MMKATTTRLWLLKEVVDLYHVTTEARAAKVEFRDMHTQKLGYSRSKEPGRRSGLRIHIGVKDARI
jgi:hypothetical protein